MQVQQRSHLKDAIFQILNFLDFNFIVIKNNK